ncbi:MAG TPA: hypothetical protein VL461_13580 [Dictyobacter sp.]|nr:hypothetical protein [Dictyobacter sp.]
MKNRNRYPQNWKELSRQCKERAQWRCQKCGVKHRTIRISKWTGRAWPVYLQAAHTHHDPHNNTPDLVAVCPACHWHYFRKPGTRPSWIIEKIKHNKLIAQAYLA